MKKTLSKKNLISYLANQLSNFFPDEKYNDYSAKLNLSMEVSLTRTEYCFSKINNKYFKNDKEVIFNHLNGDQYAMFLYILSNQIYIDSEYLDLAAVQIRLGESFFNKDYSLFMRGMYPTPEWSLEEGFIFDKAFI